MQGGIYDVLRAVGRRQGELSEAQVQAQLLGLATVEARGAAVFGLGFAMGAGLIAARRGRLVVTSRGRRYGRRHLDLDLLGESIIAQEAYLTDHEIAVRHDVTPAAIRFARARIGAEGGIARRRSAGLRLLNGGGDEK